MRVTDWVTELLTDWVSVSIDFTDVTLVSDDTYRRLNDPEHPDDPDESYLVMKVILWWKLSRGESCLVMKVTQWWKLPSHESYPVMKFTQRWQLPSDESYLLMKAIYWWKLSSDESYLLMKVI